MVVAANLKQKNFIMLSRLRDKFDRVKELKDQLKESGIQLEKISDNPKSILLFQLKNLL